MHLRWRTVVVTGAGGGLGREVALRFARVGSGVVVVDPDAAAAEGTAELVRERRVGTWTVPADVDDVDDLALLVARLRDLGGADVVVHPSGRRPGADLVEALADAVTGRAGEPGAVVLVGPDPAPLPPYAGRARVMGVATGATGPATVPAGQVAAAVLDLAARGDAGTVVRW
jgi:nucleoside-diphosphate-sugar epimerase